VGVSIIVLYVGSGLELKDMEKGNIELPSGVVFPACAAGLQPALLLGRSRSTAGAFTAAAKAPGVHVHVAHI